MCEECRTQICAMVDALISDYFRDFPQECVSEETHRPKYIPMDVRNAPKAATNENAFKDMVDAADGIGYTSGEFMGELAKRSGFKDHVHGWAMKGKIPNGLARKIILTCAEEMIRERGARPALTLLKKAA